MMTLPDIGILIAVRGGSKRVKNKNIRPFAETTLLESKIEQAKRTGLPVYVNTEDEKMLAMAVNKCKVNGLKRDPYFATDSVPMGDVYVHMAKSFPHEHILYMPVTSPLLTDNTIQECLTLYYKNFDIKNCDSVVTTTAVKEYLWEGNRAINYDPTNHPRSQDLPNIYSLNFAVNVLSKKTMIRKRNILGDKFIPYEIGKIESIDIDEEDDFKIAELLFKQRTN